MATKNVISTIPSNLMYFDPVTEVNILEGGFTEFINPISGHDGRTSTTPLKFVLVGTDSYIDLSKTHLVLRCKFTGTFNKDNDNNLAPTKTNVAKTKLGPVNAIAHALFKSIRIKLGNTNITSGDTDYGYKAFLQLLFNTNKAAQDTYFKLIGWETDKPGQFDSLTANTPLTTRRDQWSDAGEIEFVMKLHSALFFHDKAIPPYIDTEIELMRHPNPNFYLMYAEGGNFSVEITKAVLLCQKTKLAPEFSAGIEITMRQDQEPIIFNLNDSYVGNYVINQGVYNYHNDTLFLGKSPKRIIIGFVDSLAYNGHRAKNPFNFQNFDIEAVRLTKNGIDFPHPPIETNWDADLYKEAYHYLCASVQGDYNDAVLHITPEAFKSGTTLYSYDMSPDQRGSADLHNAANKPSVIKFEVKFRTAPTSPIQMIVYYEMDTHIVIDYKRNVMVTHQ
jgi:hypothetical protein